MQFDNGKQIQSAGRGVLGFGHAGLDFGARGRGTPSAGHEWLKTVIILTVIILTVIVNVYLVIAETVVEIIK